MASKSKLGKTHLAIQLSKDLITEGLFMDHFVTHKTGTCLLLLEDGTARAQRRFWKITDDIPEGVRVIEEAERLDTGLLDQIKEDLLDHPETGVYVIDTFASVRPPVKYSHQTDYQHSRMFADFGTANQVCVLLVHHCRKNDRFGDSFDNISGTNGLTAGATGMIVLAEDDRNPGRVIMTTKGKDIEQQSYRVEFSSGLWRVVESLSCLDKGDYFIPECVTSTIEWTRKNVDEWIGTTAQLYELVGVSDMSVGAYGKYLAQYCCYMRDVGIEFSRRRTRIGTMVTLSHFEPEERES